MNQSEQEKTAIDILDRLMDSISIINLDMSGCHHYMLGHKSHGIIQEAKIFLYSVWEQNESIRGH